MVTSRRGAGVKRIDDLQELTPEELMELYRAGSTPRLGDLDGKLSGRMLAVPRVQDPRVRRFLSRFARSGAFPWQGKTFDSQTPQHGHGVNRLFGNRVNLFRFETSVGPSRAGAFDAVHLDYSHSQNPPLVRDVKDELRLVSEGLWLGLAYLRLRDDDHLACYFAIERVASSDARG